MNSRNVVITRGSKREQLAELHNYQLIEQESSAMYLQLRIFSVADWNSHLVQL